MADTAVGAFDFVDGVAVNVPDAVPAPLPLVATIETVYAVPLARPVMMQVVVAPSGV